MRFFLTYAKFDSFSMYVCYRPTSVQHNCRRSKSAGIWAVPIDKYSATFLTSLLSLSSESKYSENSDCFRPSKWGQRAPPKRCLLCTTRYGVIFQNTCIFIDIVVRVSGRVRRLGCTFSHSNNVYIEVVPNDGLIPTFRRSLLPPMKMEAASYQSTKRHTPWGCIRRWQWRGNLR